MPVTLQFSRPRPYLHYEHSDAFHSVSVPQDFQHQLHNTDPRWSESSTDSMDDVSDVLLRPHACPFPGCTQRFKRKYTLKDHYKSHTGEKPFVCPVRSCRKTFTTSGNLSRHKRLHPWLDKPLQCLVDGCGCEFPTEEKLERHMLSHFGEPSVHCCEVAACGRVFSTPGNLRRHVKQGHATQHQEIRPQAPLFRVKSEPTIVKVGIPPRLAQVVPRENRLALTHSSFETRSIQPPTPNLLPSDEELLETLACLFDEEDRSANAMLLKTRYMSF